MQLKPILRRIRRGLLSDLRQFFDHGVCSLFYRLVILSSHRRFSLYCFHLRQFTANQFSMKNAVLSPRCHRGGGAQEVNMAAVPPSFEDPSSTINFTADELSAVNRLMREKIPSPEQLDQISPEFYLLADGGANIHLDSSDTLLANSRESNQFINGFGTEMHSSSTFEGHLFGGSIGYSIEDQKWNQYLLDSGDSDLLIVPDSKRIFSLSRLRRQGHFILETGPNPGFVVMPQKIYFPFKEADNGLLYFPILPSPVKIDNVYSHFYREGRLDVLNLQGRASEVYQVNSSVQSGAGGRRNKIKSKKAKRSALSKSDFRSKFNRAKALIRKCRKKRTINARKRHKITTQKSVDNSSSDSVKRGGLLRRKQSQVLEKIHRKCGHVDMRRMIQFKKEGRVLAKHLPVKFLRKHRKNCPICLIAKRRRNPRPSSLNEDKSLLASWEHTFCDTSGKYRVRSRQGNYYHTVFVDSKTGEKLVFPHRKKKHFPLVFLQFVARIGMYPKKLFSDKAGEIESSTFGKLLLVRGVESITVPKGEHYSNPLAEKAIQDLEKMLKAILLDSGIPHDCWDIVIQHCALINSMTSPSLLDPSKTIFEVITGVIPDLDALPLVGCLAVRLEEKSFRADQKLDAMNQPGVFVGFANLRNTYGSVILTDKSLIVAGHQVAYDESTLPYLQKSKSDSRQSYINWLLGRVQHTQVSPTDSALSQHSSQDSPLVGPSESFAEPFESQIEIDSSDDEQVDSVIAGMTDEQKSIPAFNTFHPKLPNNHQYLPRKVRGGLQDDGLLKAAVTPRRSKRGRSAPTDAEYRTSKSVKLSKPKAKPKCPPITETSLRDNKTLLIGKQLMMHFPHYGGARGTVVNFDSEKQTYELHFPEGDKTWIEHISFEDALKLIPKSWARQEAEANYAMLERALAEAALEANTVQIKHSSSFQFTEPKSYEEATKAPDWLHYWKPAIEKEYHQLNTVKKCWEVVDVSSIPEGKTLIGSKWVMVVKYINGKYDKHRARIVALGYQQKPGIDYFENFSPTASQVTVRFIMAMTAMKGWDSADLDATCAFICAPLPEKEQIYMKPIEGFPLPEGKCLKLVKSAYGLVQAPRQYYLLCKEVYAKCKLTQLKSDQCVFIRRVQNIKGQPALTSEDIIARGSLEYTERVPKSKRVYPSCEFPVAMLIIFMYVDNNGCRYNCRELLDEFLNDLKEDGRIDMNEEGKMENYLAVRYTQDPITGAIEADQEPYMDGLFKKYDMENCNPTKLPLKPTDIDAIERIPIPAKPSPQHVRAYSMMVGELMYVAINTVPSIMFHVQFLARYMSKATSQHLEYPKKILRYLKGQKSRRIRWDANAVKHPFVAGQVHAFADSSWADEVPRRRSTFAYHLFVNNAAFSWKSALAPILALSSAEAELIGLASCAQEVAFVRKLSFELGFQQPGPTICQTDSKGAKLNVENGHFKGRSKHYELKWSFVCDYHDRGIMRIDWRPRATNVSDIGTGARPLEVFNRFVPILLGERTAAMP